MKKTAFIKEVMMNAVVIFSSYILAVVIRYRILRSEPGIDALSFPYLLIALIYSILISFTFDYEETPRWLRNSSGASGIYRVISQNAIGCFLLLSSFYVAGIVYFSRFALFLFWAISSLGLLLLREVELGKTARNRVAGRNYVNTLIIGDGRMAESYIQSVFQNPQLGIRIVGYIGKNDHLQTDIDSLFNQEEFPEPVIRWLGEFSLESVELILKDNKVNEIIIADCGLDEKDVKEVLRLSCANAIKTNMLLNYSPLVLNETIIRDMGMIKMVGLNESVENRATFIYGIVSTAAFLILMMIMKKFNMGAIDTLRGFESYRCVLFTLFSFFLFLNLDIQFKHKRRGLLMRTGASWIISVVFLLFYEVVYSSNTGKNIVLDMSLVTGMLIVCMLFTGVFDLIEKNDFLFMQ